MKKLILISLLFIFPVFAGTIPATTYQVCFTPGGECTDMIVDTIDGAKQSIFVQAYSFTSAPIAKALTDAKQRGIDVEVILDKSQEKQHYSSATFLEHSGIPTWIDYKVAIAHNKVMVIDHTKVITGSFNFTQAAQFKNAENVLILSDKQLADAYYKNWQDRMQQSEKVS